MQIERDRAEMREQLAGEALATASAEAAHSELITLRGELKTEREAEARRKTSRLSYAVLLTAGKKDEGDVACLQAAAIGLRFHRAI